MRKVIFVFFILFFLDISSAEEISLSPDLFNKNSEFNDKYEQMRRKNAESTSKAISSILPSGSTGSLLHISAEGVCGFATCIASDLFLYGPSEYHPTYNKSASGYFSNISSGEYKWRVTFDLGGDESKICTGVIHLNRGYKNFGIRVFSSSCEDAGSGNF